MFYYTCPLTERVSCLVLAEQGGKTTEKEDEKKEGKEWWRRYDEREPKNSFGNKKVRECI